MKYNEWVTQLNANLLNVPEAERRRVLDYYAEAYADRRAAQHQTGTDSAKRIDVDISAGSVNVSFTD